MGASTVAIGRRAGRLSGARSGREAGRDVEAAYLRLTTQGATSHTGEGAVDARARQADETRETRETKETGETRETE